MTGSGHPARRRPPSSLYLDDGIEPALTGRTRRQLGRGRRPHRRRLPLRSRRRPFQPAGPRTRDGAGAEGFAVLTPASVSRSFPFVATYQAHEGWEALGDPSRLAIVQCLADRPRAVGELAEELPISRPAVSQHLKVLKSAGLVTDRAEGTRRVYRLNPAGISALRDQLDTFWSRALSGFQDVAETD